MQLQMLGVVEEIFGPKQFKKLAYGLLFFFFLKFYFDFAVSVNKINSLNKNFEHVMVTL